MEQNELTEPIWSVVTFDEVIGHKLPYADADKLTKSKVANDGISGKKITIVTADAAERMKVSMAAKVQAIEVLDVPSQLTGYTFVHHVSCNVDRRKPFRSYGCICERLLRQEKLSGAPATK